jgi:D-alanyl-D-alanine carboxypeptidase
LSTPHARPKCAQYSWFGSKHRGWLMWGTFLLLRPADKKRTDLEATLLWQPVRGIGVVLRRFVILALALAGFQGAFAQHAPAAARGSRHAAMILDANTGAVLHSQDGDEQRHPASLTKMMTLYLAFETIESGRLSMTDKITISPEAASQAPSKLELDVGEQITVSDAIRAVITKSANDVAVALAEKIGGTERTFVGLMNTRARDLGMSKTHFENASGLPNSAQVTTARDMITLGLRLQDDFPKYYPLFAMRAFEYNGATHRNHNTMLNTFQGVDGIKTGYTSASGFNLVSSVHRGDRHLVGAVFGGSSAGQRNSEMRSLLMRAFARASTEKTRKPAPSLIAKLKSSPKLAERPKPKDKPKVQVAEAAKPAVVPAAPPAVAPAPEPAPAAEPAPTPEPAPQAEAAPQPAAAPIDVFKVKRVIVAPRQGPPRPAPSADETTDMSPEDVSADAAATAPFKAANSEVAAPADALAQNFAAADAPPSAETVVPKMTATPVALAARLPSPLDDKIAMLGASDAVPAESPAEPVASPAPAVQAAPVAAVVKTAAPKPTAQKRVVATAAAPRLIAAAAPVERGRPPSSLQAQASHISAPLGPQQIASLDASAGAQAAPGGYEIQIGAYGSIDEAQKALTNAQTRAARLLAGHASVTHPVQTAGRQMFRARFSGFDANRASSTCNELRRSGVDCFVMTAN